MKAIIRSNSMGKTNPCKIEQEFKNFEEFSAFNFNPSKSIFLCNGKDDERGLALRAFPDRDQPELTTEFGYTVTLELYRESFDIKLIPKEAEINFETSQSNIYVSKDMMLDAVKYFFNNYELHPNLPWFVTPRKELTDAEMEEIQKEIDEYVTKNGDPFDEKLYCK